MTLAGTKAAVKLWRAEGSETLWEADFGGRFSRMRDAEIGDIYGDGKQDIAIATHDQGVVAVLRSDGSGAFSVERLSRLPGSTGNNGSQPGENPGSHPGPALRVLSGHQLVSSIAVEKLFVEGLGPANDNPVIAKQQPACR